MRCSGSRPLGSLLASSRFPVEPRKFAVQWERGDIAPIPGCGMRNTSSGISRHRSIVPDIPKRDWTLALEMGTVPDERRTRTRRRPAAAAHVVSPPLTADTAADDDDDDYCGDNVAPDRLLLLLLELAGNA